LNKNLKPTLFVFVSILLVFSILQVNPSLACKTENQNTITRGTYGTMQYTQFTGALDQANYVIRVPDQWNGMLIIGCHAYSYNRAANMQFQFDALAQPFIAQGYAYTASDYGAQGFCVKEGMKATHQLTEYVIDHFHVRGKIFIFGGSMGGEIALLLADKYPHLYSGVLDICGPKNLAEMYQNGLVISTSSLSQIRTILGWPATVPDSSVQGFKTFCTVSIADLQTETGGSPDTKPHAYARISPVNNTDIKVPVISLVGGIDFVVPLPQTMEYKNAITASGHSSLYTMIVVPTGGHIDAKTMAQAPAALTQLIEISNSYHTCPVVKCHR
jgi:dipeptidyl aminopeptidase/acylaminoacyl peptidase